MQDSADLTSEINRILSADTNRDLLSQIKHIQSYESQIQRELSIKSQQIIQLHTQLKKEIQNICTVVKENQVLKTENNRLKSEISAIRNMPPKETIVKPKISQQNHQTQTSKRDLKEKECQTSILELIELQTHTISTQSICIQTQPLIESDRTTNITTNTNMSTNKLLKKIQQLQQTVSILKCQKHDLQKRIRNQQLSQQYSSIDSNHEQQNHVASAKTFESRCDDQSFELIHNLVKQLQREEVKQIKYIGELSDQMKIKKGMCQFQNGLIYNGEFNKGKRQGRGVLSYKDSIIYEGYWKNNEFNGRGKLFLFQDQEIQSFIGNFVNGKRHGYGTLIFKSGRRVISEWCNESAVGNNLTQTSTTLKYGKNPITPNPYNIK